jgi:hypothetical protein
MIYHGLIYEKWWIFQLITVESPRCSLIGGAEGVGHHWACHPNSTGGVLLVWTKNLLIDRRHR